MRINRSFVLGIHFLKGRKRFSVSKPALGAILGIAISLIPLVVVLEVTGGMISGITKRYLEIGSYHLQIRNFETWDYTAEKEILSRISGIPGVKTVFPVISGVGLAYSPDGRTGVTIKALPGNYWQIDKGVHKYLNIVSGVFNLSSENYAMVSTGAAEKLGIKVGDRIKLLTAKTLGNGKRVIIKPSYFLVKGIFSTGYYELDSLSVYINEDRGRVLFGSSGESFIGVKVERPDDNVKKIASAIERELGSRWHVFTWFELEKPMYENFKTTQALLLFIMLLIVVVAAVNISSALVMIVMEKESDTAILKASGVRSDVVTGAYLLSGFLIGFAGTLIGIALGLFISVNINEVFKILEDFLNTGGIFLHYFLSPFKNIPFEKIHLIDSSYYLDHIPVKIRFFDIFLIGSVSFLLSTAAAVIPAITAGKLRPMDIIRRQ